MMRSALILLLLPGLLLANPGILKPWESRWASDFGELTLHQHGMRLVGDWLGPDQAGLLEGEVSADGRAAAGRYRCVSGANGRFRFQLDQPQQPMALIGHYGRGDDQPDRPWQARRSGSFAPYPLRVDADTPGQAAAGPCAL